jgi:phosphoribosyl 1,2-cyclic phosphodiesterase
MSFLVRFWGVRGSIPTPGRGTYRYGGNTSCLELDIDGTLFVCDAGTGVRELGADLMERDGPVHVHWFFSHMHWDHIQGFPFFTPVYVPGNRFTIYGVRTGDTRFARLLSGQMRSSYFPVEFADLQGNIEANDLGPTMAREVEGVMVRSFEQHHPGLSYGYSFEKNGVKVVYSTDNEIDMLLADPELPLRDPAAMRPIPADLVAFCSKADLLICDAQYGDEDYPSRVGWGHPRATTVVDLAVQAGARQLALHHHDPMHNDDAVEAHVAICRQRAKAHGSDLFVFAAREGFAVRADKSHRPG